MNTKRKRLLLIVILVCLVGGGGAVFFYRNYVKDVNPERAETTANNGTTQTAQAGRNYLLNGYPEQEVPLYKVKKILSTKYYFNTDPKNTSRFDETNYGYYNVVFDTESSRNEFLDFYKSQFDEVIAEAYPNDDMVRGRKGSYRIVVSHYGEGTGYLQVYVADPQPTNNTHFANFPSLLSETSLLREHEKSFGLLNQKGGEKEFTQYYSIVDSGDKNNDGKDDLDEYAQLVEELTTKFAKEMEYSFDVKTAQLTWKRGNIGYTLVISRSHGRVYIMIREPLS